MPPPGFIRIFIIRVFGVMKQYICILCEINIFFNASALGVGISQFIVRKKHKRFTIFRKPVSHTVLGMGGGNGFNIQAADGKTVVQG